MTRMMLLLGLLGCVNGVESQDQPVIVYCYCPAGYTCDPSGNCIPPTGSCAPEANSTSYPICHLACSSGFGDCNHVYTDGCETPLNTTSNCGACGHTCPSGSTCQDGACTGHCGNGACEWRYGETHTNCPSDCLFCGSLLDCCDDGSTCRSSCPAPTGCP